MNLSRWQRTQLKFLPYHLTLATVIAVVEFNIHGTSLLTKILASLGVPAAWVLMFVIYGFIGRDEDDH